MRQYVRFSSPRQFSMSRWKVGGALLVQMACSHTHRGPYFQSEGGILLGFRRHGDLPKPRVHIERGVVGSSARLSSVSQMRGRGWESFTVRELSFLKSMQKRSDPSFFLTKTTALHHGLLLGRITPASSISFRWSRTSSNCGGGILRNRSLNGGVSGP